jgi:type II secretory pathway pseudopilin PulG
MVSVSSTNMFVCLPNESRGCHAACRVGFTLMELLVVMAVIAVPED